MFKPVYIQGIGIKIPLNTISYTIYFFFKTSGPIVHKFKQEPFKANLGKRKAIHCNCGFFLYVWYVN